MIQTLIADNMEEYQALERYYIEKFGVEKFKEYLRDETDHVLSLYAK